MTIMTRFTQMGKAFPNQHIDDLDYIRLTQKFRMAKKNHQPNFIRHFLNLVALVLDRRARVSKLPM